MKIVIPKLLFIILLFSSCNSYLQVEKRRYRDGFYVRVSNSDIKSFNNDSLMNNVPDQLSKLQIKPVIPFKKTSINTTKEINQKISLLKNNKQIKFLIVDDSLNKQKVVLIKRSEINDGNVGRKYKASRFLGIVSIFAIIIGGLSVTGGFLIGIVFLIIGFFCAIVGVSISSRLKNQTKSEVFDQKSSFLFGKAKRVWLLNLIILITFLVGLILTFIGLAINDALAPDISIWP